MVSILTKLLMASLILALASCSSSSDPTDPDDSEGSEGSNDPNGLNDPNNPQTLRLVESKRTNSEGSVLTISISYTSTGNIQGEVFDRDGEIFGSTTFESTVDGRFIRRSEDTDQDGIENQSSTYGYTDGLGLTQIFRVEPNGLVRSAVFYQFEGGLAVSREDRDIDEPTRADSVNELSGDLSFKRTFEYEDGRISVNNVDTNGDGIFEQQEVYSYNPNGTLATTTLSSASDGVKSSAIYVYEQGDCNLNPGNSVTAYYCVTPN